MLTQLGGLLHPIARTSLLESAYPWATLTSQCLTGAFANAKSAVDTHSGARSMATNATTRTAYPATLRLYDPNARRKTLVNLMRMVQEKSAKEGTLTADQVFNQCQDDKFLTKVIPSKNKMKESLQYLQQNGAIAATKLAEERIKRNGPRYGFSVHSNVAAPNDGIEAWHTRHAALVHEPFLMAKKASSFRNRLNRDISRSPSALAKIDAASALVNKHVTKAKYSRRNAGDPRTWTKRKLTMTLQRSASKIVASTLKDSMDLEVVAADMAMQEARYAGLIDMDLQRLNIMDTQMPERSRLAAHVSLEVATRTAAANEYTARLRKEVAIAEVELARIEASHVEGDTESAAQRKLREQTVRLREAYKAQRDSLVPRSVMAASRDVQKAGKKRMDAQLAGWRAAHLADVEVKVREAAWEAAHASHEQNKRALFYKGARKFIPPVGAAVKRAAANMKAKEFTAEKRWAMQGRQVMSPVALESLGSNRAM